MNKHKIEELLLLVARRMTEIKNETGEQEKFPVSLVDIDCWEWPQGVGLYGLFSYYEKSQKSEVLDFLYNWFDRQLPNIENIEKNINTTSPMLTLACLYELDPKSKYLDIIKQWCDWIMSSHGLIKTGDGAFQHMITGDPNKDEILIDTLFMTLLFLTKAGIILGNQSYLNEAAYQVSCHVLYLYEKTSGLFFHGWNFEKKNNYGGVFWGRGNAWYTVGILEMLKFNSKIDEVLKRNFLNIYRHQVSALLKYQNQDNGLWHTVIDDPTSYIEISASAGFLCGILKGIKSGILDEEGIESKAMIGVESILKYISQDGTVEGVSYGTPIGGDRQFYKDIKVMPMTYGQALMILMLGELL